VRAEKILLQPDPALYFFINQGCLKVDGMDDQEEMYLADVSTFAFALRHIKSVP
jgi:hypothetical protein